MKRLYRKPLDWFEQYSTGAADEILVNSGFTKKVFRATFSSLNETPVEILYPALDTSKYEKMQETANKVRLPENALIISSVNRYERKKVKL